VLFSGSLAVAMSSVPERPSNEAVIQSCTLLNPIEPEAQARLVSHSFMAYAEKGEIIWMAGSPSEFCAVVGVGFVKMSKSTPHGTDVAVELLGPGQCFGLMAVVEGRDFPLSAIAVTNTWYLKIPSREMQAVYAGSSALKDQMVRNIGPRLRKAHDMMTRLSSGRVEERIAAVLFILADSYGQKTDEGIEIEVPLTRHDIAEMAGTTTETAIRILSRWQKDGVASTDRHRITLLNQDALLQLLHG
jgi:CRP-like cAMP-binding protein